MDRGNDSTPASETLKDEADRAMAPNAQNSYAKMRTVREYYRALREQLEYEQLAGKLVPASEVEEAGAFAVLEFKRGFAAAAMRAGQAVSARFHLDEQEVLAVFQEETNAALAELGQRFRDKVMELQEEQYPDTDDEA